MTSFAFGGVVKLLNGSPRRHAESRSRSARVSRLLEREPQVAGERSLGFPHQPQPAGQSFERIGLVVRGRRSRESRRCCRNSTRRETSAFEPIGPLMATCAVSKIHCRSRASHLPSNSSVGSSVRMMIAPPMALRPYSAPCGPLSTSICLMSNSSWLNSSRVRLQHAVDQHGDRGLAVARLRDAADHHEGVAGVLRLDQRHVRHPRDEVGGLLDAGRLDRSAVKTFTVIGTSRKDSSRLRAVTTTSSRSSPGPCGGARCAAAGAAPTRGRAAPMMSQRRQSSRKMHGYLLAVMVRA